MNAPSQPSLLPRRIAASLVDLALVGGLWLLVLYRLAVRFEIAQREPNGTPIYAQNQRESLAEIAEGLNFGRVFGDFYYSIHGRGLVLGLLSLVIFSLIAWVLVPANTGWSAGHRALGLEVTDMRGEKPPLDSYLRRYLVGIVDLFPYVIPGLLGWIIASRNEHNQRIGDLSADTKVVAATTQPIGTMPEVTTKVIRPKDKTATADTAAVDLPTPPPPANTGGMVNVAEALAGHTAAGDDIDYPVLDLEDTSDVLPTIEADPPPPTHQVALSESIPVTDKPKIDSSFVASLNDHEDDVAIDEPDDANELPDTSFAENWHFPEAQDAPVWTPEPISNNGPKTATQADAVVPEEAESAAATAAGMGDPVWNEEWAAWLYWDAKGSKWLRHDADEGWTPIGDSQKA